MKQLLKKYIDKTLDYTAFKIGNKQVLDESLTDQLVFRIASESILRNSTQGKTPYDIFNGISDEFWFRLNTEGLRRNSVLRNILPGAPSESVQEMFTGSTGDTTLREGFDYYKHVRDQYEKYKGDISLAHKILDFGCGWGRIIRFFMKDIQTSKIWGCDPVEDMIKICKEQNKYCNFELINTYPPNSFQDNTFDLIYSYSIFSHFSEDFHLQLLHEIKRILKPGGIYITTTRNRNFFKVCAELRELKNPEKLDPGRGISVQSFPDTEGSLKAYDEGAYCHHSFNLENWPFWGDTAIPKKYVVDHWSKLFTYLDYLEVDLQNIIVVQKP